MTRPKPARRGVTLIEMLTVISIIGVLVALSVGALVRVRSAQTVDNSEATLSKVHGLMMTRWSAVVDQAKRTVPATLVDKCGGDKERATALWTYATLKNEFPMTFAEAKAAVGFGTADTTLQPRKIFLAVANGTAVPTPEGESAALIYAAISEGGNAGNVAGPDGTDGQTGDFTQYDPATQKILTAPVRTYRDAWGQSIAFARHYNTPEVNAPPYTRANRLNLGGAAANVVNTLDPTGRLSPWGGTPERNAWLNQVSFQSGVTNRVFVNNTLRANFPAFVTWQDIEYDRNTVPTLISAGANKIFNATVAAPDAADDNLLSYRLRREGDNGN